MQMDNEWNRNRIGAYCAAVNCSNNWKSWPGNQFTESHLELYGE